MEPDNHKKYVIYLICTLLMRPSHKIEKKFRESKGVKHVANSGRALCKCETWCFTFTFFLCNTWCYIKYVREEAGGRQFEHLIQARNNFHLSNKPVSLFCVCLENVFCINYILLVMFFYKNHIFFDPCTINYINVHTSELKIK